MAKTVELVGAPQRPLFEAGENPKVLLPGYEPSYTTPMGAAYLGDSLSILRALPENSVNAVITSPPYALHFQKEYGNVEKSDYVRWFLPFGAEIRRDHATLLEEMLEGFRQDDNQRSDEEIPPVGVNAAGPEPDEAGGVDDE